MLLDINLRLFDGGAAGGAGTGAGAAGAAAGDGSATGDTTGSSAAAAQSKKSGDLSHVKYGRQDTGAAVADSEAPSQSPDAGGNDTLEARQREFDELVNSDKFKDIYTKRTQDMIDRRFAKSKATEAENTKLREIADLLSRKYGVTNDADFSKLKAAIEGDDATWAEAAENAGMTIEQYRQFDAIKRENAAYQAARQNDIRAAQNRQKAEAWYAEAQTLKQKFPQFDLRTELADRNFVAAINAGVPMEMAYKGKYYDQFMGEATQGAEKRVVDNIRAKGKRPAENGAASQSAAFTVKSDPSKLTLADFNEIARRVAHGETISF